MRLSSQLINGISRVLQNLLKYFNGIVISTSFVLPAAGIFPVILILNLTLFYLGYLGKHILYGEGGGHKCPTLAFSKLEMVWQWDLAHMAHIEAILCQVKINCEFWKWRIIFDDVSTTLHNAVKFTIFWYILLTGVFQSSPNTYYQDDFY